MCISNVMHPKDSLQAFGSPEPSPGFRYRLAFFQKKSKIPGWQVFQKYRKVRTVLQSCDHVHNMRGPGPSSLD